MNEPVRAAVILLAAGEGTRLGHDVPKAFVECAGKTILERALTPVLTMTEAVQIVVVAPERFLERARELVTAAVGKSLWDSVGGRVVAGGPTRQSSVASGLAALDPTVETVLVHDSSRMLTPTEQFESVLSYVRETGRGAVPGLPVDDTIKRVERVDGARGEAIYETVDRVPLRAVQTPQGFLRSYLVDAHRSRGASETDDASLISRAGHPVDVVLGSERAFKITYPWDYMRAERLIAHDSDVREHARGRIRNGIGIDVHAFDSGRELWLAGLHWPGEKGLAGHSDGDVVCHAIVDALLSAASLGDIGSVFGTDDDRFEGARGATFLRDTQRMLCDAGWTIEHVAVQVAANKPRFADRRREANTVLTELLDAPVSVTATTTDGLGFTGRGEGVAAIATALIRAVQ